MWCRFRRLYEFRKNRWLREIRMQLHKYQNNRYVGKVYTQINLNFPGKINTKVR